MIIQPFPSILRGEVNNLGESTKGVSVILTRSFTRGLLEKLPVI
jgi:hypothetical protein